MPCRGSSTVTSDPPFAWGAGSGVSRKPCRAAHARRVGGTSMWHSHARPWPRRPRPARADVAQAALLHLPAVVPTRSANGARHWPLRHHR